MSENVISPLDLIYSFAENVISVKIHFPWDCEAFLNCLLTASVAIKKLDAIIIPHHLGPATFFYFFLSGSF